MSFTKYEKRFLSKAIKLYWEMNNSTHPSNEKDYDRSKVILDKLNT